MSVTDLVLGIIGAAIVVAIFAIVLNQDARRARRDAYRRNHAHKRRWYE